MKERINWDLYLVTDGSMTQGRPLGEIVSEAILGGAGIVQIREKKANMRDFLRTAETIREITRTHNVPLIINDRVDIALAIGADGVHLGQDDMPYEKARALLGPQAIIGLSVTNPDQARQADSWDLDYLGIGPIFFTRTKEDLKKPIGFEGLEKIAAISRHRLIAIGGIKSDTAARAISCGASGVAVVSAIMSAASPKNAAEDFLKNVREQKRIQ